MPLLSYKNDQETDERLNPATRDQDGFNEEASDILGGLNFDNLSNELNSLENNDGGAPDVENPSRSEKAQDFIRDNEAQSPNGGFSFNPGSATKTAGGAKKVAMSFLKKRGSTMLITGVAGTSIVGILSFFGGATMVVNLFENATWGNDAASSIMDHQARRQIKKILKAGPGDICGDKITIKCKSKTPSYKFLDKMSKNGIVALGADGKAIDVKQKGLVKSAVAHYSVDLGDGNTIKKTPAQLADFLDDPKNVKIAAKVWGRKGVVNMRWRAWNGKYIGKKLFARLGINKKGGIAENDDTKKSSTSDADEPDKPKKTTADERTKAFKESVPNNGEIKNAGNKLTTKLGKIAGRVGKGGAAYTAAVAGCVVVKLPSMVAAAKAGVELAQLIPFVTDMVFSPGSMQKGAGLDSGFAQEASEAVGNFLTKKVANENGEMKSAIEAPELLLAIGVNKNKIKIPENLAPGYSALHSTLTEVSQEASAASDSACNVIMSPYAMYGVMTAQAAVAASGVGLIPTLLNVAGGLALSKVFEEITKTEAFKSLVSSVIQKALANDYITEAIETGGYVAGQALGMGLISLPSLGNISRHIPVLLKSQLDDFNSFQNNNELFHRDLEVATLSPFDTSSRYTFLGSLVYNMNMSMVSSGNLNNSFSSVLSNVFSLPAMALSSFASPANAAINYKNEGYCDYAADWKQEAGDQTPAVNAAGFGCAGFTQTQLAMDFDRAEDLLAEEGWIDRDKAAEGDIDALIDSGYIKDNNPLMDFIADCGDGSSGDYIFNNASCTVAETGDFNEQLAAPGLEDERLTNDVGSATVNTNLKNEDSIAAISVFLTNHQTMLALNGEDEGHPEEEATSNNSATGGITGEVDPNGWASPVESVILTSPYGYRNGPFNGYEFHDGLDLGGGGAIFAVRDGTVTSVVNGYGGGWGNNISIDHGEVSGLGHIYSFYAHLESISVSGGQQVKAGQQIGVMGTTGSSTGVHLHFGIYKIPPGDSDKDGSTTYNPAQVVPQLGGG